MRVSTIHGTLQKSHFEQSKEKLAMARNITVLLIFALFGCCVSVMYIASTFDKFYHPERVSFPFHTPSSPRQTPATHMKQKQKNYLNQYRLVHQEAMADPKQDLMSDFSVYHNNDETKGERSVTVDEARRDRREIESRRMQDGGKKKEGANEIALSLLGLDSRSAVAQSVTEEGHSLGSLIRESTMRKSTLARELPHHVVAWRSHRQESITKGVRELSSQSKTTLPTSRLADKLRWRKGENSAGAAVFRDPSQGTTALDDGDDNERVRVTDGLRALDTNDAFSVLDALEARGGQKNLRRLGKLVATVSQNSYTTTATVEKREVEREDSDSDISDIAPVFDVLRVVKGGNVGAEIITTPTPQGSRRMSYVPDSVEGDHGKEADNAIFTRPHDPFKSRTSFYTGGVMEQMKGADKVMDAVLSKPFVSGTASGTTKEKEDREDFEGHAAPRRDRLVKTPAALNVKDESESGTAIEAESFNVPTFRNVERSVTSSHFAGGETDNGKTVISVVSAVEKSAGASSVPGALASIGKNAGILPAIGQRMTFRAPWIAYQSAKLETRHAAKASRRIKRTGERTFPAKKQILRRSRRGHSWRGMRDGYWRSEERYRHVIKYANAYQLNGTVVLVVTGRGAYDVILNWCISMQRLGLSNYFLVALDDEAQDFFQQRNAPVVQLPTLKARHELSKSDVWIERTFVAYMILKTGINVLVTDADAVMMKSPFNNALSLFDDRRIDIVSSPSNFPNPRRGELPRECQATTEGHTEWRHQPCMGWVFFRSNRRVIAFFDELFLTEVLQYRDDQIGFNCAIRRAGANWKERRGWTVWKAMVSVSKRPRVWFAVLPAANYVRNCTEFGEDRRKGYGIFGFDAEKVEMYHCKGYNKKKNGENNGFWFTRRDWKRHAYEGNVSFAALLGSVSVRGA